MASPDHSPAVSTQSSSLLTQSFEFQYLRCIVIHYVVSGDHEYCFPVLAALLQLTRAQTRLIDQEVQRRKGWLSQLIA
jgi:hypothetical protein